MGGSQPGPADRPMPHYWPISEYPISPGYPPAGRAPLPGYWPMPAERPADDPSLLDYWTMPGFRTMPDHLSVPDYPPAPDRLSSPGYPSAAGHLPARDCTPPPCRRPPLRHPPTAGLLPRPECPPIPGYPSAAEYPAVPRYLSVRDHPPVPDWPAPPVTGFRGVRQRLARLASRKPGAPATADRKAALAYLTVPVFVLPLFIYLTMLRGPYWARRHAAQALNVWFTGLLYDLSAVIMGAMLALDSPRAALIVFAPLVAARWAVTLAFLARAARAAGRGAPYAFPAWLCMRIAR